MQRGNGQLWDPTWGPVIARAQSDSTNHLQHFQRGGESFLRRANASPHQTPAWDAQSPGRRRMSHQFAGGEDLLWGSSSSPWVGPPVHAQQQQRIMRNAPLQCAQRPKVDYIPHRVNNLEQTHVSQERGRTEMMPPRDSPCFPAPREGSGKQTFAYEVGHLSADHKFKFIERVATGVYKDLLTGLKAVSTEQVAEGTLSALGVTSFETIGVMPQDIPCLRKLAQLESKVNAFVHSHMAGKKVTTLHDLSLDLTRHEGVKDFEDLGLGPLLCHPLVGQYFSPPAGVELHKITTGEVIQYLSDYIGFGKDTKVQVESFLSYVANKRSLPIPQQLCIRIQDFGLYVGYVRRSKKTERDLIGRWESRAKAKFVEEKLPRIIERVNVFLSAEREKEPSVGKETEKKNKKEASLGKRKFAQISSDASPGSHDSNRDEVHVEVAPKRMVGTPDSSTKKQKAKSFSMALPITGTCPYPSAAEERVRLKKQDLQQFVANSKQKHFYLSSHELQEFVTVLKDACENDSVHEVLMKIIEMPPNITPRKRNRATKFFRSFPAIGLLNLAVLSVKAGYWDSLYTNFLDAADETNIPSKDQMRSVQVAACIDVGSRSGQGTSCQAAELCDSEDIVAAVSEHFEQHLRLEIVEKGLDIRLNQSRALWRFLHWVCECEDWVASKFSVGVFATLGFGKFSHFLEENLEALPRELISLLSKTSQSREIEARVPKDRVLSFLTQALPTLSESGSLLHKHMSDLLHRQFNVSSVEELGANCLETLLNTIKDEQSRLSPRSHVFFLAPLLPSSHMEGNKGVSLSGENGTQADVDEVFNESRVGALGSMTSADATKCLLRAPFLADLSQWSQWDLVFAPTLGPLLDWLEREGSKSGLHAIVTCEGSVLRIHGTATAESFLLATMKGFGDRTAAALMSLVALYGGTASTPTALLKSHAFKGLEILLGSPSCEWTTQSSFSSPVGSAERKLTECLGGQALKLTRTDRAVKSDTFDKLTACGSPLQASENNMESPSRNIAPQILMASRFVIDCLSCVIPELRIFATQILLPAFSALTTDGPAVLLNSCITFQEKSILHGVGLGLGIIEWISNYNSSAFGPTLPTSASQASGPEDLEVHKKDAAGLLVTGNVRGSIIHASVSDIKNGYEDVDMESNQYHNSSGEDQGTESPKYRGTDCANMIGETSGKVKMGSKGMPNERGSLEAQAKTLIEEIRKYEFGIGQDIQGKERELLTRQHARMGRALHRLSSDLYSQDSHFVLELVQNADDNAYHPGVEAALVFLIQEGRIVVLNNETGFTASNIRALCDVGNSTKAGTNTGYIGHKGIGFKSVFRVTNSPEIHSNGFHFKFDISEGDLGFILPTSIPPLAACDSLGDVVTSVSEEEMTKCVTDCWNTRINLPIKASLEKQAGMTLLASKFNDLHPSLLLFLHRLRRIAVRNDLTGSMMVMHREDIGEDLVKVTHEKGTATWMVVRRKLKAAVHRAGITDTEIALAFQLNEVSKSVYEAGCEHQQVFAFLPLRGYGLRFIVQGDFKVPSSREEVDCDSDWNQWLRSEIPDVFIQSSKSFQKTVASGSPGKAISNFMKLVPMEGEVLGFFSPLPRMILSSLRGSPCLPVEGGGWALPCVLLRGWSSSTRELLSDAFLNKHLGLSYLDKDVVLSDILASKLGLQQFGAGTLVAVMKSVCEKKRGLATLGLKWVESWLLALHDCFESDQQLHHMGIHEDWCRTLKVELQSLPYIPLSNGSFTSLSEGPVWFAGEPDEDGLGVNSILNKFVLLWAELRTVHPGLLSLQNDIVTFEGSAVATSSLPSASQSAHKSFSKVMDILQRLGVSRLSSHEVLKSHILPAMAKDNCLSKDHLLVVEYLGFVMLHLESNCVTCRLEKFNLKAQVQKYAVIMTSNGLVRAGQQPIHFCSKMGNIVSDMKKILNGTNLSWIEVSPIYLQLQGSYSDCTKWRTFFKDLGVTDFVQVVPVEKKLADKSASEWKTCAWVDEAAQEGSWIVQDWQSPELLQLLTTTNAADPDRKEDQKYRSLLKERFASVLLALDRLWDDYYFKFCQAFYSPISVTGEGPRKPTLSSFQLLLQQRSWVMSSLDEKLHVPKEVFRCCDDVKRILGSNAPFAVTQLIQRICLVKKQIQSEGLMEALGLRTSVAVDDIIRLLRYWSHSKSPFEASVAQMTLLYSFLWEKVPLLKENVLSDFRSEAFIFVPLILDKDGKEAQKGSFYTVGRVCWSDPTHALDQVNFDQEATLFVPVAQLSNIYPGLHDFFVGMCLVHEKLSFNGYLEVLKKLSAQHPPRAILHHVMEVFCLWSMEIRSGMVEPAEILRWRKRIEEEEICIFASNQDKWVSLSDRSGLVCICDDEKLGKEFSDSLGCIHFLRMTDDDLLEVLKQSSYQGTNTLTLQPLVEALCIPKLSEVVDRTVIKYGLRDTGKIEALVGWALPFAQRYVKYHFVDQYKYLQQIGITEALRRLQFVVVDELYCQYSIGSGMIQSNKRTPCTCILKDNTLHVMERLGHDYCNMYIELSRLFFGGKSNLPVANFLHLITLMASSGSSENEVEGFILNGQGITPNLDGESLWTLCTEVSAGLSEGKLQSEGMSPGDHLERHVYQQNLRNNGMKGSALLGWPPKSWEEASVTDLHLNQEKTFSEHVRISAMTNEIVLDGVKRMGAIDHRAKCVLNNDIQPVSSERRRSFRAPVEEMSQSSKAHLYQKEQYSRFSEDLQDTHSLHGTCGQAMNVQEVLIDPISVEDWLESGNLTNFQDRDFLVTHPVNVEQREMTGRSGEVLVFQYLSRYHGAAQVKWLNQEAESGAAYDIVILKDCGKEFIEVKTTRSGGKDWFEISPREWEFARKHADSFTIIRVFLSSPPQRVKLLRLPNPVKLVQDHVLQLALLVPAATGNSILEIN